MVDDKAARTGGEIAAMDEAAGTAEVLPPWFTPCDEGEELLPWMRTLGRRGCLRRERGCVAVGRGHRCGACRGTLKMWCPP